MNQDSQIEIRVSGKIGNQPLSPANFDIREIRELFDVVEALLYPNQRLARAPISYSIEEGSVRNVFRTSMQGAATFMAILTLVGSTGSLDGLELSTARALNEIQKSAIRNDFTYEFGFSRRTPELIISPKSKYFFNENLWVEAEFYFYGVLVSAGGKDKINIHLLTKERGLLTIATKKDYLQDLTENVLYKRFSIRAKGKQNAVTGELDSSSLEMIEMTPYYTMYNEQYLSDLIKKATPNWEGVDDIDKWLEEIRGING